jgi:ferredoxin-NADP reductase
MRITAKEVGAGTRSLRWLRPGTRVLIEGPFGVMRADRRSHRDVLLMAAGVGLTTMRGIAEEIADEPRGEGPGGLRTPSVVVLQRTRHRTDPLFVSEFTDLARRGNIQFRLLTGARHHGSGWWGGAPSGRIGHLDPARALIAAVPDIADHEVYLCGPRDWMREVKRSLNELAVDPRVVHAEEFDW